MSILEYNIEFDQKLEKVLKNIFNQKLYVERINQGEVNYAYKVFDKNNIPLYHARIFRYEGHPDLGKLVWISKELSQRSIPQSKIIYYDKSSEHFLNGFMVSEWIEGKNGWQSIKDADYSLRDFITETSKILSKVHQIKTSSFGWLYGKGLGYYDTYEDRIIKLSEKDEYNRLVNEGIVKEKFLMDIVDLLKRAFTKIALPKQPVLVHSDPTPDNVIVKDDGTFVLIDWDDSEGSWWVRDYSYLRYWSDRPEEIKKGFLEGYGDIVMDNEQLEIAELIEWILQSLRLLPYFKYDFVNEERFQKRKERLLEDTKKLKLRLR
jgi:thiamine kinase-like enzyme